MEEQKFETAPQGEGIPSLVFEDMPETKSAIGAGYWKLVVRTMLILLFCLLIFTKVFQITRAYGNEMFPAIKDGDLILAFRAQQILSKNDVVVYEHQGGKAIGRILAFEGDIVTLDDSGILSVNGTVQSGEILSPTYAKDGLLYPYRVPENSVFVLGDNRLSSKDSRDYGAVLLASVKGKVITILRHRGI